MTSHTLLSYLIQLCSDIDNGRPLQRFDVKRAVASVAVPTALGLASVTFGGCHPQTMVYTQPEVIVVGVEHCTDGADNDGDRYIDCADPDCRGTAACPLSVPAYAAPPTPVEHCTDGVDNDGDRYIDCADPDCRGTVNCQPSPTLYGVPMPPPVEVCSDGGDNDGDGLIDCSDPDCDAACGVVAEYGVPFPREDCSNGMDDDGDGLVDGADDECPTMRPMYGVPFIGGDNLEVCNDGQDNDSDGRADCQDPDCSCYSPPMMRYAIRFPD